MDTIPTESILLAKRYRHPPYAKYLSEFIGTFFLVFTVGCNVHSGSIGAALSIGAILMVMVYSLGSVSGAHFNPAVTFAIALTGRGKIGCKDFCYYILVQIFGGVLGGLSYSAIFNDAFLLRPNLSYSVHDAMTAEILYTMALCYVVLNVATTEHWKQGNTPNNFFGLAIGLTVTASAIAIGPISGCSLNPAVSVGALFAAISAAGGPPTSLWALYILSPLGGAACAALFFYFVQGGLTDRFEYEVNLPQAPPPQPPRPSVAHMPPPPRPKKRMWMNLSKNQTYIFDEETENHNLAFGLAWETREGFSGADIDASCVKYDADGQLVGSIYFAQRFGVEARRKSTSSSGSTDDKDSIIIHLGDNATGRGTGFGMLEHKSRSGEQHVEGDDEQIQIRKLTRLKAMQPRARYLFFCVNVFSAEFSFEAMQSMRVRVVDQDTNDEEICRFERKDMTGNTKNGFILGVLFCRSGVWQFRAIDMEIHIEGHGTYRAFEPILVQIVESLEAEAEGAGSM
jgi:aquaporin Z